MHSGEDETMKWNHSSFSVGGPHKHSMNKIVYNILDSFTILVEHTLTMFSGLFLTF